MGNCCGCHADEECLKPRPPPLRKGRTALQGFNQERGQRRHHDRDCERVRECREKGDELNNLGNRKGAKCR